MAVSQFVLEDHYGSFLLSELREGRSGRSSYSASELKRIYHEYDRKSTVIWELRADPIGVYLARPVQQSHCAG